MHTLILEFFGHRFAYETAAPRDVAHLGLIFRAFRAEETTTPVAARFRLSDDHRSPYVDSLIGQAPALTPVRFRNGSGWRDWTFADTPLPPFSVPPLTARHLVLHGSCVTSGDGAVAVVGPSFAGKSALLLESLRLGGRAVADDLVVVTPALTGPPAVWRYPKPVGVRRPTLDLLPWLRDPFGAVPGPQKLSFPAREGRPATTITHLDDVFGAPCFTAEPLVPLRRLYLLDRSFTGVQHLAAGPALAALLANTCNSGFSRSQLARCCAELIERVPVAVLGNSDVTRAAEEVLTTS